jgi:hypothetical protein
VNIIVDLTMAINLGRIQYIIVSVSEVVGDTL